jgi:hypothetical protein
LNGTCALKLNVIESVSWAENFSYKIDSFHKKSSNVISSSNEGDQRYLLIDVKQHC